jgi:3-phosphoshikimate 1-carboxyvinyltransferase
VTDVPVLTPPASKSDAHRALVLASIAGDQLSKVALGNTALANDIVVIREGLTKLGQNGAIIDCHDAGAPFRFLVAQAALVPSGSFSFVGTSRLRERPHQALFSALLDALAGNGLRIESEGAWPLQVHAPTQVPASVDFRIDASASSQFASSLLLAAARLVKTSFQPSSVTLVGPQVSAGYLDLTLTWLRAAGFGVSVRGNRIEIVDYHRGELPPVPGDWSSLTYLLGLAWKTGALVDGVNESAEHPDKNFLKLLRANGLTCDLRSGHRSVAGTLVSGLDADAVIFPDSMPTVAALACVAPAPSVIRNTEILTVKESDRLAAIERLVRALGGKTERRRSDLVLTPPSSPQSFRFDALDDHRLAMAAAVAACLCEVKLELVGHDSVKKSFPGFWGEYEKVASGRVTFV